jgi:thiamine biosynthesis lipoprotein
VGTLKSLGIKAGLVSVAGDIRAFGRRPDGKGWQVGIRDPRSDDKDKIMASIELIDEAVSTSGDYERFFVRDGVRYHHLLDPKTGYPARGCMSVTVIAKDAVLTDGLSTGVFVMGPQKGLHLLERLGLDGVIITSDGRRLVTEGIKGRVRWTQDS